MKFTPERAKELRSKKGLSYAELGRMSGVNPCVIKKFECGICKTKNESIYKIAKALGVRSPLVRNVYMEVTQDELSLPLAVADSIEELAILTNHMPCSIISSISRNRNKPYPKFISVRIFD